MTRMAMWLAVFFAVVGPVAGCGRLGYEPNGSDQPVPALPDAGSLAFPDSGRPLPDAAGADSGGLLPDTGSPDPLMQGLIGYYPLDSVSDGESADMSGNGRSAACVPDPGDCPAITNGRLGGAVQFDGVRHLRISGADGFFDTPAGFSIAAWVWLEEPFHSAPLSKMLGAEAKNTWQFEYSDDGTPAFTTSNLDVKNIDYANASVAPATWVHLAGTWDGASKKLYVNGIKAYDLPFVVAWDRSDIVIGGDENNGAPDLMFSGRVDDVRIYDRVLSGDEVAKLAAMQ